MFIVVERPQNRLVPFTTYVLADLFIFKVVP